MVYGVQNHIAIVPQILILVKQGQSMPTKLDKLPKNFCYLANQGFSSHPHGRARPCCFSMVGTNSFMPGVKIDNIREWEHHNNSNSQTISEFINDPQIKKLRKELVQGDVPDGCK